VHARAGQVEADKIVDRIWAKDHTVWSHDPTECANRLGWLTAPQAMLPHVGRLEAFARTAWADGFTTAVLMGMGGSSLAPEVMQRVLGSSPGALELIVLDTTHPDELLAVAGSLDLPRTLFIASSKSGGTIETRSQLEYFWHRHPQGRQYVAITDEGSSLDALARSRDFREVFLNDPDVGGRYSVLTYFGLVPGALIGADVGAMLEAAKASGNATRTEPADENVAVLAGIEMAMAAAAGRNKLALYGPANLRPFGAWLEQLLSESTGKDGTGILPVEGEMVRAATPDRISVDFGGQQTGPESLTRHPGALDWWNWEFATAIAGHVLGVNPFDQPAVQQAKDATAEILSGAVVDSATPSLGKTLADVAPPDYIALLAYLPRNHANDARLVRIRAKLATRFGVAATGGFGPRYLHSTGQFHKAGPNTGVFLQIIGNATDDVRIPGASYTFGELNRAQALGDLHSLRTLGRRVTRTTLDDLEGFAQRL
jgi:hypothetical protein